MKQISGIEGVIRFYLLILFGGTITTLLGSEVATAKVAGASPADCRKHIARIVCFVDPVDQVLKRSDLLSRPCLAEGRAYVPEIVGIYKLFPKPIKTMMCGLNRIFIEKKFWASGYAHRRTNSIGIQQEILDKKQSLADWLTWKERLSFKIQESKFSPTELPTIYTEAPGVAQRAAYYIIAHELAHLIDMLNGISDIRNGDFTRLSWRIHRRYIHSLTLPPDWIQPCFYLCRNNKIELSKLSEVYRALKKSSYISLYATRNPSEDFAETLTIYLLSQLPGFRYELNHGNQTITRMNAFWQPKRLREKLTYVELLLKRPYLFR